MLLHHTQTTDSILQVLFGAARLETRDPGHPAVQCPGVLAEPQPLRPARLPSRLPCSRQDRHQQRSGEEL